MATDNTITVVEIAYSPTGAAVVHVDAWQALTAPLMQLAQAEAFAVYSATGAVEYAVAEAVKADIQARIAGGSSSPVLKSHLDDLGITAAVEAWATE